MIEVWTKNAGSAANYEAYKNITYVVQAASDTQAPTVLTTIVASAASEAQINLLWTASTDNVGVTGYRIYRNGIQIATVKTTSYSNTGLAPATTYSYTISAYDAAGNVSAQSAAASSKTITLSGRYMP